jgi:hypothetical protein
MRVLAMAVTVVLAGFVPAQAQETAPKVPRDSVRVVVTGCLKGRVLAVTSSRDGNVDVQPSGPDLSGRSFRLAGKKDVISVVKQQDGNTVRVTGLLRKMDLEQRGMRFKGGRVIVGGARPTDPTRPNIPDPADNVVVMDVEGVQPMLAGCSISGR